MESLHSETLDFLVRVLREKHQEMAGLKTFTEGRMCNAQIDQLRKRITLEFFYQTHRNRAGDSPK